VKRIIAFAIQPWHPHSNGGSGLMPIGRVVKSQMAIAAVAAALPVLDGHITGGRSGDAWASAQLSYEGAPLHAACDSKKAVLPGAFTFEAPAVSIPRLGWSATEAMASPTPA
jgi:hypothetical protein